MNDDVFSKAVEKKIPKICLEYVLGTCKACNLGIVGNLSTFGRTDSAVKGKCIFTNKIVDIIEVE